MAEAKRKGARVRRRTTAPKPAVKKTAAKAKKPTAAKKVAKDSGTFTNRPKIMSRYERDSAAVLKTTGGKAEKLKDAAEALGMSIGKATYMLVYAQLADGDKLFNQNLSEDVLGTKLVDLRDKQGLRWNPDIWARTLISEPKAKQLYAKAGGTNWSGRVAKADGNGAPKATKVAKSTATKGKTKTATGRAPRRAKATAPSGGGTRSARAGLLREVQDLGTEKERIQEILEGRPVKLQREVQGIPMSPTFHHVLTVKSVAGDPRIITFFDENKQTREFALSELRGIG